MMDTCRECGLPPELLGGDEKTCCRGACSFGGYFVAYLRLMKIIPIRSELSLNCSRCLAA